MSTQLHRQTNTELIMMTQMWHRRSIHRKTIRNVRKKVNYALRVSAHSGPGRPSDFAGRQLMCVWAASYRRFPPPSGHCSLLAACRPPPPAGRAAPLIPYLAQRAKREQGTMLTTFNWRSVINQYWYNVNSSCVITGKSNMVFSDRWRHFCPFDHFRVLLKGTAAY